MKQIDLSAIAIDAGTQVRASLNEAVVAEYAERMGEGVQFPPIVLFHDGNQYYLGDGFHRFMATQRLGLAEIAADIRAGTKTDALWFALGANRTNGQRLNDADKTHAIALALRSWPDRSATQIAEQIGCTQAFVSRVRIQVNTSIDLPSRVTGKDGKSYPASRPRPEREIPAREAALDKSRAGVTQRREQMREMAAAGHTSRQIAATLGLGEEGCRRTLRDEGIDVPADRVVGKVKHLNATRIVERMVMDADNLTADVNLIDLEALHPAQLPAWIASLTAARKSLDAFIRQLTKELEKHGEAA